MGKGFGSHTYNGDEDSVDDEDPEVSVSCDFSFLEGSAISRTGSGIPDKCRNFYLYPLVWRSTEPCACQPLTSNAGGGGGESRKGVGVKGGIGGKGKGRAGGFGNDNGGDGRGCKELVIKPGTLQAEDELPIKLAWQND
ncbi:unnamed protein product [Ilex paraguariensis]|uniref:Uncharacterized protein n=1 Tax=Ilex paraguariensis TaxID=185542 RepID=A0ABC8TR09_9AQUA